MIFPYMAQKSIKCDRIYLIFNISDRYIFNDPIVDIRISATKSIVAAIATASLEKPYIKEKELHRHKPIWLFNTGLSNLAQLPDKNYNVSNKVLKNSSTTR